MKLDNLHHLLQHRLTRKEFLHVVGLTLLSVVGVKAMLGNIDKSLGTRSLDKKEKVYSEDPYGG